MNIQISIPHIQYLTISHQILKQAAESFVVYMFENLGNKFKSFENTITQCLFCALLKKDTILKMGMIRYIIFKVYYRQLWIILYMLCKFHNDHWHWYDAGSYRSQKALMSLLVWWHVLPFIFSPLFMTYRLPFPIPVAISYSCYKVYCICFMASQKIAAAKLTSCKWWSAHLPEQIK